MAWAILRRHPHGLEVPRHAVSPCLVCTLCKLAFGEELPVDRPGTPETPTHGEITGARGMHHVRGCQPAACDFQRRLRSPILHRALTVASRHGQAHYV